MHEVKRDLLLTGRCIAVAVLHILNFGIALSKDKTGVTAYRVAPVSVFLRNVLWGV